MQPSTAFSNDDLPDAPSSGAKDTVAIIAIIVILAALLIGGAYYWKRAHNGGTNTNTVATSTSQNTTQTATSTPPDNSTSSSLIQIPPPTSVATTTTPAVEWLDQTFALGKHDVSFKIPKGYHSRSNYRDLIEIIPDSSADNRNPEPVMTIKLVENLELAKVMDNEAKTAPTGDVEWHDATVNNLTGKALKVDNKGYPNVDVIFALKSDVDALVLRQYQDGLWDPFADVVNSFKEVFVNRKG